MTLTGLGRAGRQWGAKGGSMDPMLLREYEAKLVDWLAQGYQLLADDIDGELRVTVLYVAPRGGAAKEREQEYWPQTPEIVQLLAATALLSPRHWPGRGRGRGRIPRRDSNGTVWEVPLSEQEVVFESGGLQPLRHAGLGRRAAARRLRGT